MRPTPTFVLLVPVLDQALLLLHSVLGSFTDTTRFRFELDRFGILAQPIRLRVLTTPLLQALAPTFLSRHAFFPQAAHSLDQIFSVSHSFLFLPEELLSASRLLAASTFLQFWHRLPQIQEFRHL